MGQIVEFKEEPKGLSMPCRTLPAESLSIQLAYMVHILESKLSINSAKEENVKRIIELHKEIQKSAWGLSIKQMLSAFDLYINGNLSLYNKPLEPISGYLDVILFKKVIQAYKELKEPKTDLRVISIAVYENWKSKGEVNEESAVVCFDYLYDNGVLPKRDSTPEVKSRYEQTMTAAKGYLYAPLFDDKMIMEKEGLKDTPRYREICDEMREIVNNEHRKINAKFKTLVLKAYFKKLKVDLSRII